MGFFVTKDTTSRACDRSAIYKHTTLPQRVDQLSQGA